MKLRILVQIDHFSASFYILVLQGNEYTVRKQFMEKITFLLDLPIISVLLSLSFVVLCLAAFPGRSLILVLSVRHGTVGWPPPLSLSASRFQFLFLPISCYLALLLRQSGYWKTACLLFLSCCTLWGVGWVINMSSLIFTQYVMSESPDSFGLVICCYIGFCGCVVILAPSPNSWFLCPLGDYLKNLLENVYLEAMFVNFYM